MSSDISFQQEAVEKLRKFLGTMMSRKSVAVKAGDEELGRLLLCAELMATALSHELSMWIRLKENKPNDAWDELVEAQATAGRAVQVHSMAGHLEETYIKRLYLLENLLFPPQIFMSVGIVVRSSKCSICGTDYALCDHVKGQCYGGQFCCRIIDKAEVKEVSIVSDPANKHCRVTQKHVNGQMRDAMTWLPVPDAPSPHADEPV
jgi:hypothetical protein